MKQGDIIISSPYLNIVALCKTANSQGLDFYMFFFLLLVFVLEWAQEAYCDIIKHTEVCGINVVVFKIVIQVLVNKACGGVRSLNMLEEFLKVIEVQCASQDKGQASLARQCYTNFCEFGG